MSFFSEYTQVKKLLQQKQQVIFYAESKFYYQYFEHLINDLLNTTNIEICYITSDKNDPLLQQSHSRMKVVLVKWMLGFLFSKMKADVVIMTMPDLDNFLFKRSKDVGCYIYMFHAAVSTHQQYRNRAFFHYDAIFCTGDYQQKEIRRAEEVYRQPAKELIPYGYPLFDAISKKVGAKTEYPSPPVILIAPSWFDGCIFDSCLEELLRQLAGLPYHVILRSHPEYEKRKKKEFKNMQRLLKGFTNISIDDQPNVMDRLASTHILITDRSGIAFEFAFGVKRPVLFIDTPLKQVNPDWKELGLEPIENHLRSQLGISVAPGELQHVPGMIVELEERAAGFADKISGLEKILFYNSDSSYVAGMQYVMKKIEKYKV
jgi:hypothetical protein